MSSQPDGIYQRWMKREGIVDFTIRHNSRDKSKPATIIANRGIEGVKSCITVFDPETSRLRGYGSSYTFARDRENQTPPIINFPNLDREVSIDAPDMKTACAEFLAERGLAEVYTFVDEKK